MENENSIKTENANEKIAVILVRGLIGVRKDIKDTLRMLNLKIKNSCVIIPKTDAYMGMLKKVKDYVTYGEVDDNTIELLKTKRKWNKKAYRLNPPRKGFERKGIKKSYNQGGALGYRGKKINDLIKRMI